MFWKIVKRILLVLLSIILLFVAYVAYELNRAEMFKDPEFETEAPALPDDLNRPAILIFSKTNGFRHVDVIGKSQHTLETLCQANGWSFFSTENGATFRPDYLAQFDAVVWNYTSGTTLLPDQQLAFEEYMRNGGGYVGIHAAGGDPSYEWDWYVDSLLRAQFVDHPMFPQLQKAVLRLEDRSHPSTSHLPDTWMMTDEWYNFAESPRSKGVNVLVNIDEESYKPQFSPMGADHPMIWHHRLGEGRVFYSALGHNPDILQFKGYRQMLSGAIAWAAGLHEPAEAPDSLALIPAPAVPID
ncbi:MAG: ThuA domain-containing protein [Bacteroidota bacterium]